MLKITKYRTVAIIHPWLSLECEVVDGDKKYYANISVNDKGEQEELHEDARWAYCKPMDMIGYDTNGNEIDYDVDYDNSLVDIDEDIFIQMLNFWNNNPVFDGNGTWKEWK